jgi:hypothetical protein
MNHWVMDYETMANCFVAVFEHYKTEETKVFVIHELRNDFDTFAEFLHQNADNRERHISFNGLAFDAQITEYFFKDEKQWSKLPASRVANEIYQKAQLVIDKGRNKDWLDFYEAKMRIPQIDVFKLNHWDNPAKRSSLKWIQFSMDWYNLQDMPIHHSTLINTQEEIDDIIGYCINDVKSTKAILNLSKGQINLRNKLTQEYDINLFSASEPKISKELFLHYLAEKTGKSKKEIKYSRTNRKEILGKDLVLPYIEFKTPEFQELYNVFHDIAINPLRIKGALDHTVNAYGVKIKFGLGGVHGCADGGVYEATDTMVCMTSDVRSYYPNLAIRNKWSPAHIGQDVFCELYEWFYDERVKIPKSNIMNYVYKIILNSTFGLSNDQFSFLYDPQFLVQVTINGQLTLMMLLERIMEEIPGAIALMQNTDGIETMIPREYMDKYIQICDEWEELTQLELDHGQYQKMIIADVNSYIAVNQFHQVTKEEHDQILKDAPHSLVKQEDDKFFWAPTVCKGRLNFVDLALHKNKSHLIKAKALYNFFIHDISPEKTIADNNNIFDSCIGKKIKGDWHFVQRQIVDGEYTEEEVQPTIRYYITKKSGSKIIKISNKDGRQIQVESGRWMQQLFNKYENKTWESYNIDESYYLQLIYKEIEKIAGARLQQVKMF